MDTVREEGQLKDLTQATVKCPDCGKAATLTFSDGVIYCPSCPSSVSWKFRTYEESSALHDQCR